MEGIIVKEKNNKICPRCNEKFPKRKIDKLYHHLRYYHDVNSSNKKNQKKT